MHFRYSRLKWLKCWEHDHLLQIRFAVLFYTRLLLSQAEWFISSFLPHAWDLSNMSGKDDSLHTEGQTGGGGGQRGGLIVRRYRQITMLVSIFLSTLEFALRFVSMSKHMYSRAKRLSGWGGYDYCHHWLKLLNCQLFIAASLIEMTDEIAVVLADHTGVLGYVEECLIMISRLTLIIWHASHYERLLCSAYMHFSAALASVDFTCHFAQFHVSM